jgi:branched-chain amino acid transport system ATP-binding protein
MEDYLKLQNLSRHFGDLVAVDDVSINFKQKELTAVIGPNGAGKSTLFNLMSGLLAPTTGQVIFKGQPISGLPPHKIQRLRVGRSFQITNIFQNFTVFENIRLGLMAHNRMCWNLWRSVRGLLKLNGPVDEIVTSIGLESQRDKIASTMSHGDQKRLEIALSLTGDPELLFLDEPTAGINSEETKRITELIRTIAAERGITIIFCEHDMEMVFDLAERIVVMAQGRILADGTGEEISQNEQVRSAYLGTEV